MGRTKHPMTQPGVTTRSSGKILQKLKPTVRRRRKIQLKLKRATNLQIPNDDGGRVADAVATVGDMMLKECFELSQLHLNVQNTSARVCLVCLALTLSITLAVSSWLCRRREVFASYSRADWLYRSTANNPGNLGSTGISSWLCRRCEVSPTRCRADWFAPPQKKLAKS